MRKNLIISMVVAAGLFLSGCKKNDNNSAANTLFSNVKAGTYVASGKIILTVAGKIDTIPMKTVEVISNLTNGLVLNAADTTSAGFTKPVVVIGIYSPINAITLGSYFIPGNLSDAATYITYTVSTTNLIVYEAIATAPGSRGTITLTTLTAKSIVGTFNATVAPITYPKDSSLVLNSGSINCSW